MRQQFINFNFEQHNERLANILPHLEIGIVGQHEQILQEQVHIVHQSLTLERNELIDAGDRVRSDLGVRVAEKLQKLGYQIVERAIVIIRVELIVRVLAYFLQGPERALAVRVVLRVQVLAQSGQELGPRLQAVLGDYGRYQYAYGGSDQLARVAYAEQALALYELFAVVGEFVEECFGVVFKYEPAQGSRRVVLAVQFGQYEYKIVVEIGILVELFQSLLFLVEKFFF